LAGIPLRSYLGLVSTFAAIFGVVLSTLIVPLPEELALLGAGYVAHSGSISLVGAWLASWSAIVIGDTTTYCVGRFFLERILDTRFGKKLVSPTLRKWAEDLVQRHGFRAILLGRFLVALRGPVYLAIGAAKYPGLRFTLINAAVGLVEVALIVGAGYLFGQSHKLAKEVKWIEIAAGVLLALLLVIPPLLKRRLERQRAAA
jgi:membrane protein DedA with SNARE-associated domain